MLIQRMYDRHRQNEQSPDEKQQLIALLKKAESRPDILAVRQKLREQRSTWTTQVMGLPHGVGLTPKGFCCLEDRVVHDMHLKHSLRARHMPSTQSATKAFAEIETHLHFWTDGQLPFPRDKTMRAAVVKPVAVVTKAGIVLTSPIWLLAAGLMKCGQVVARAAR